MARMDPATMAMLIRVAGDAVVTAISIFKALGKDNEAESLAATLAESDDVWATVKAKAEAALNGN